MPSAVRPGGAGPPGSPPLATGSTRETSRARWSAFLKQHDAPWELDDFSEFFAKVEEPAMTTYRGYEVYKHSFGSQGPALLEALNILEQLDIKSMGRNSADYVHTVVEALKLAYADRDSYFADQAFVESPAEGLLSKAYAQKRAAQIDPRRASRGYLAGDPLPFDSKVKTWPYWIANIADAVASAPVAGDDDPTAGIVKDTTHISVIDRAGNVFDSTPSGAWLPTSVVLGSTGVMMSVRGESFWLDKTRAAQLRPRSRPRYTLTPSIVLKNGEPFMAIGTPGGDNQEQTILQGLLNVVEFWQEWYPNLHEAFRWPRVQTLHFYGSFWPHAGGFNQLNLESDFPDFGRRGAENARSRRQDDRATEHPELRDGRARRSGNGHADRGCGSAAGLLRDGVLTATASCAKAGGFRLQPEGSTSPTGRASRDKH